VSLPFRPGTFKDDVKRLLNEAESHMAVCSRKGRINTVHDARASLAVYALHHPLGNPVTLFAVWVPAGNFLCELA